MQISTREEWLTVLNGLLDNHFSDFGYDAPENVRITCGFPSIKALGAKNRRVGEVWDCESSDGNVFEISISPLVDDAVQVGAILVHEKVHTIAGLKAGHKGEFAKVAKKVGLEGKMTATTAGEQLTASLQLLVEQIGPYPHQKLTPRTRTEKPQANRHLKIECPECKADGAPYLVRVSRDTLNRGAPICPIHECDMVEVDAPKESEDDDTRDDPSDDAPVYS